MKNWKRILAAAGTAALLVSNLGAVSQVVFADDITGTPETVVETISTEAAAVAETPAEPEVQDEGTTETPVAETPTEPTTPETTETPVTPEPTEPEDTTAEPTEELTTEDPAEDEIVDEEPAEEEPVEEEEQIEPTYSDGELKASADGIEVALAYSAAAQIPDGASLSLSTIASDSDDYQSYYNKAEELLAEDDADITYAQFLDIAINDADGNAVTPVENTKVTVSYTDSITVPVGTKISAISGDDILMASVDTGDSYDEFVIVTAVSFDVNGNAVYGVVGVKAAEEDALIDTSIEASASDGASVKISGMLPADATASIEPVTYSDEELREYFGDSFIDGINTINLYDITIWVDGKEWEPNDTVSVVISNPTITPVDENADDVTTATDEENIVVAHLQEDTDTAEKTVEILDTEVIGDDVAFTTESFSVYAAITYTVDYYYNDNEYHQAGGTTMNLSDLFTKLGIDASASDVTEVTFTDYDLVGVEQIDGDWQLASLAPFNTDEELVVTFADGSQISIITKDATYYGVTDPKNVTLLSVPKSINKIGKYKIFGGGNGIATVLSASSNWKGGNWGHATSSERRNNNSDWSSLKGHVLKADGTNSSSYYDGAENNKFKSSSVGNITWDGNIEEAYISFGYLARSENSPTFYVKITGPNNGTAEFTIKVSSRSSDNTPYKAEDVWQYLTFDATDFVSGQGTGNYTVQVTVSDFSTSGNNIVGDMGWTIYGVSADSSMSGENAIVGYIGNQSVSGGNPATGTMTEIVSQGEGEVWFNVQGGEYADGDTDRDYLEIKTGDYSYKELGTGGDIAIEGWDADDIARPNSNQTAPSGYTKFSNRFSFGIGSFNIENETTVSGVRKSMEAGNDAFGSIMLQTTVKSVSGYVNLTKTLDIPEGTTFEDGKTFSFDVTQTDGSPTVYPENDEGDEQTEFEISFTKDQLTGGNTGLVRIGKFTFGTAGTYTYKITEVNPGTDADWTYSDDKLYVTFTVVRENNKCKITETTYTNEQGETLTSDTFGFTNTYVPPTGDLKITKAVSAHEDYPDSTKYVDTSRTYKFNITVEGANGVYQTDAEGVTVTFEDDGKATVTLSDGGSVTIKGLPKGASYTVTEDSISSTGFTVSYDVNGKIVTGSATGDIVAKETQNVTVKNVIKVVLTGVNLNSNAYVSMVLMVDAIVAAALIYSYAKRRIH